MIRDTDELVAVRQRNRSPVLELAKDTSTNDLETAPEEWLLLEDVRDDARLVDLEIHQGAKETFESRRGSDLKLLENDESAVEREELLGVDSLNGHLLILEDGSGLDTEVVERGDERAV